MGFLDFLYPKYCVSCRKVGSYLCSDCFALLSFDTRLPCFACNKPSYNGLTHPGCKTAFGLDGMFASLVYAKTARKLIASFKYKPYVSDLRHLLGALFIEGILEEEPLITKIDRDTAIVPIPLHSQKARERGYNHADLLATELAKYFHLPKNDLLSRVKSTKSQFGLMRDKRKENLKGAFTLSHKPMAGTIILVDDIVTTGTTFHEAAKILKRNGVGKVYGAALAHGN